ncbi:hypothetical protein COE51_22065 [Bacillus pseudomycoides]|nr:hypothetical protein COE51_22065 [Bacillus pseudomycoides]
MEIKIYKLNVFTKDEKGGNLAGGVLDTKGLTTETIKLSKENKKYSIYLKRRGCCFSFYKKGGNQWLNKLNMTILKSY